MHCSLELLAEKIWLLFVSVALLLWRASSSQSHPAALPCLSVGPAFRALDKRSGYSGLRLLVSCEYHTPNALEMCIMTNYSYSERLHAVTPAPIMLLTCSRFPGNVLRSASGSPCLWTSPKGTFTRVLSTLACQFIKATEHHGKQIVEQYIIYCSNNVSFATTFMSILSK